MAVNTAAVKRPEVLSEMASALGRQCTVLAIDAKRKEGCEAWEVVVKSGKERTGIDVIEWAKKG